MPVPVDGVVGLQPGAPHCTAHEVVLHKLQGGGVWQGLHVVPDETDAKAFAVVPEGVRADPVPAPALVDVPVASSDKAAGEHKTRVGGARAKKVNGPSPPTTTRNFRFIYVEQLETRVVGGPEEDRKEGHTFGI